MIDFMIDFDKCYKYLLLCIDMIPTLWSIMNKALQFTYDWLILIANVNKEI